MGFFDRLRGRSDDSRQSPADFLAALKDSIGKGDGTGAKNLHVDVIDRLANSSLNWIDTVEFVSNEMDPLVRLMVCYMFLEEADIQKFMQAEVARKVAEIQKTQPEIEGFAIFSYKFLRQELSDAEFSTNFSGYEGHKGYFSRPITWAQNMQRVIGSGYLQLTSEDEQARHCTEYCMRLISHIDDPDLIARFVVLATDVLNETGFMTQPAQSTLAAMEL